MRPTIVYIHPHLTMRAGATTFVLVTAKGLHERGWPVVIVTGQADPEIVGDCPADIVEVGGPLPSDLRHWLQLGSLERRVFAALDRIPNKILFPQVLPANYWAFAYRAARPWVPCVWMCHEPSAFVHSWSNICSIKGPMRLATIAANPPLQVIDRLLVAQTDRIIANSQFTAAAVHRIYGRDADAIAHPPVRTDTVVVPCVPRDCIVSLGSLIRFKRVDLAVQGYALAQREMGVELPPLLIAGDGPERPALQRLVDRLGLRERVHLIGRVSDEEKRALYARALLFASTAPGEPFGIACIEAMAAGVPVLAPDQGGPKETVVDGVTGTLYRAGDAADLARNLAALLARRSELSDMGEAAIQHVHTHFTPENTICSLEALLEPYHSTSSIVARCKSKSQLAS